MISTHESELMQTAKLAKLLVGLVTLSLSMIVFVSSGSGTSLVASAFGEGRVGAAPSEFMGRAIEVVMAILTALASTGLLSKFKWFNWLMEALKPLVSRDEPLSGDDQFREDAFKLLKKAISDKDKDFTVMLVERIAASDYITSPTIPKLTPVVKEGIGT